MKSATLVEDFDETFELTPARGRSNAFIIHPKEMASHHADEKMTFDDWNKFEKDIADAFEQVP